MRAELKKYIPVAEAFCKLLHPFAEVVIHNLKTDQIEAIYNPFSKRVVRDSSHLDRWDFTVDPTDNVIGPYSKTNYDGRPLKCISIVIRDINDKAIGFVCVNMDIAHFNQYQNVIEMFLGNNDRHISESRSGLFRDDLYERINLFVQDYCQDEQTALDHLSRVQKKNIIQKLKQVGAFQAKGAPDYLARILNVSRATIYNYIKNAKGDS